MLKIKSVCLVNRTITIEHNNQGFECACSEYINMDDLIVGVFYSFVIDNRGVVIECNEPVVGLNEDEQYLVHGVTKAEEVFPQPPAPLTPKELELIDNRPIANNFTPTPPVQIVYIGAELLYHFDGEDYDVEVQGVVGIKVWVKSQISIQGDFEFIVNLSELKLRKTP